MAKRASLMDKIRQAEESETRVKELKESSERVLKIQNKTSPEQTKRTDGMNPPFEHTNRTVFLNTPKKLQRWHETRNKQGEIAANRTYFLNIPPERTKRTHDLNIPFELFNQTVQVNCSNEQSSQPNSSDEQFRRTHSLNTSLEHTKRTGGLNTPKDEGPENFKKLINNFPITRFTKNQQIVYGFLLNNPQIITSYNYLEKTLNIPVQTLRHILRKFEKLELISKSKYCGPDNIQGLKIQLLKNIEHINRTHHMNTPPEQFNRTVQNPSIKIDRENISLSKKKEGGGAEIEIAKKKLLDLTDQDIKFFWPHLYDAGFSTSQIKQVIECLDKKNKQPNFVFQSLDAAEYALENGLMLDKHGQKVQNPNSYLFRCLAKDGTYTPPNGYVSPERQAEQTAREEAERIIEEKRKKQEAGKEAAFLEWLDSLSDKDKQEICKNSPSKKVSRQYLKSHWLKNIYGGD